MDAKEVKKIIEKEDVKFLQLWFVDLESNLKTVNVFRDQINSVIEEGASFDGSSIRGFTRIEESDMFLRPDFSTFAILPFEVEGGKIARVFCDVLKPNGECYEDAPRTILKKNLQELKENWGYTFYVGPELEFFYFKKPFEIEFIDYNGYFDLISPDTGEDLLRKTVYILQKLGIKVEYIHHEVSPSQYELDFKYSDALTMADNLITAKYIVKRVAIENGYYATFMPKPVEGINGSGLHVHQSLFKGNKNAFYSKDSKSGLSEVGEFYVAGLLNHAKEITLITNQWVNSYKRLVPGYEAPVYISWGRSNRSPLIRVPAVREGNTKSTRIEYRSPDPAANPYLLFSVLLKAGMKGVENRYSLVKPQEENIYKFDYFKRKEEGIDSLPGSLIEAIMEAERGTVIKETLGESAYEKIIMSKKIHWDEFRIKVTDYEIKKYLPVL